MIQAALDFFGKLEGELDTCAGACSKPLFGVDRKLDAGPPEKECVIVLLESLETLLAPGIVCFVTFIFLLSACFGGFWLCCGNNKAEEVLDEDGNPIEIEDPRHP